LGLIMTLEKYKPGDTWHPPKSADHNATARMVDQWQKAGELGTPHAPFATTRTSDLIKVKNLTGSDLELGSVVQVGDSLLTDTNRLGLTFEGLDVDDGVLFAILREPAAVDAIVGAQIGGICMARVNISDTTHEGCSPFKAETALRSGDRGPYRLWWTPGVAGIQECMVFVDAPASTVIALTPSGGIPARSGTTVGSAACILFKLDGDTLTQMTDASNEAIERPVKNLFTVDAAENTYITCSVQTDGKLILMSEDCPVV